MSLRTLKTRLWHVCLFPFVWRCCPSGSKDGPPVQSATIHFKSHCPFKIFQKIMCIKSYWIESYKIVSNRWLNAIYRIVRLVYRYRPSFPGKHQLNTNKAQLHGASMHASMHRELYKLNFTLCPTPTDSGLSGQKKRMRKHSILHQVCNETSAINSKSLTEYNSSSQTEENSHYIKCSGMLW